MPRRRDSLKDLPTADEAQARWADFTRRLDQLDSSVASLLELGELLLQALQEAAQANVPSNVLLDLVQRVIGGFREARADRRGEAED